MGNELRRIVEYSDETDGRVVFHAMAEGFKSVIEDDDTSLKKSRLHDAFDDIIKSYSYWGQRDGSATELPFDDINYRWAYAYLFIATHVRMIQTLLDELWQQQHFPADWNNRDINVCSVGGGPGTDLIGLALLKETGTIGLRKIANARVLDSWTEWSDIARTMFKNLGLDSQLDSDSIQYHQFDFLQHQPWSEDCRDELYSTDLVTMVKFISAVSSNREDSRNLLTQLLLLLKPGAYIFIVENSGGEFVEDIIVPAAEDANCTCLHEECSRLMELPEKEIEIINYSARITGKWPQKSTDISFFLYRKNGPIDEAVPEPSKKS